MAKIQKKMKPKKDMVNVLYTETRQQHIKSARI